ncbi:MAG TPA: PIN domain-containing protein [Candidatus Dormibacteraeota bacterium]
MLVLLDTTVLIDFLRGRPATQRVLALRARGDRPCTTAINVEEVVRGLRVRETRSAAQLLQGLQILPLGAAEGWRAGEWRRDHAARGITLSQADCLIAAAAVVASAVLATGNPKDFPVSELRLEHWPVGA